MHQVRRALIMAAGRGERLQPVTDSLPKPLIPVRGTPMIDTIVEALWQQGIREIGVVVGYRAEAFRAWARQRRGVTLLENPWYASCNNISSLYAARAWLSDVMILDGDQVIRDPAALAPAFERSGYNAVWTEEHTGEWLLQAEDGRVVSCSRTGGDRGWQLFSVSRWSAADGERLRHLTEIEFMEKGNRGVYWDDVALFLYPERFTLGIFPMARGAVLEIDTVAELCREDPAWREKLDRR